MNDDTEERSEQKEIITQHEKLNGKKTDDINHKDEDEVLLNDGSSDGGTESINEDVLLNSDEDVVDSPAPYLNGKSETKEEDKTPDENVLESVDELKNDSSENVACLTDKILQTDKDDDHEVSHVGDNTKENIVGDNTKENISKTDQVLIEETNNEMDVDSKEENISKDDTILKEKNNAKIENILESMDVDQELDENIDTENDENLSPLSSPLSRDDIIPSPILVDVSKHKRISAQISKIEKLKENLRCEEASLALLRKLIDSQRGKTLYKSASKHQSTMPSLHPKQPQQIAPKGSLQPSKQPVIQSNKTTPGSQQPVQKYYIQVGNQLVPAPPPTTPVSGAPVYQYANGTTSSSNSTYPPAQQPSKPAPPPKQTAEQKQSAAKAALRRQLEQTLLQIPPPRPPPADWKAIPNVNSMDFMMLVGLDEVVDSVLDIDSKPTLKAALEELGPYNPRICSLCKVDFSPCWKSKDVVDKKSFVLCERCSLQSVKKELKAEHTSRLKSAFLKALKQEQEIEEKIKAGEDVVIGNITGADKPERNIQSPQQSTARISSPKSTAVPSQASGNHTPSPTTDARHHQSSTSSHHHRHQVVQHYPHHTSLVQQLHHQHIQQQQLEMEPSPRHSSSRWHPYMTSSSSHHHRDHHPVHHRSYVAPSSTAESSPHQEYYVVHHPQHANVRYVSR